MLNIFISLFVFFFLIALGILLMFLDSAAYYLLVPCFLYLLLLKGIYREANCIALETKDFLICLLATLLFLSCYHLLFQESTVSDFAYLYLITFITTMMFVNTIRFKSLM